VLSGGNVDPLVLLHVTQHGMVAAARYLSLRVRVRDRPGALAELLALVGRLGANVLDVAHSRIFESLQLGEVEVELRLETRGPEHRAEVVAALARAGHSVVEPS
jgi:threonine dehydratase